jgi:hypothetical protein
MAIARSLLPQAKQASLHPRWKKGARAPLTVHRRARTNIGCARGRSLTQINRRRRCTPLRRRAGVTAPAITN